LFGYPTSWCLAGCEGLVDLCDGWQIAHCYLANIPAWWLWLLYLGLLAVLTLESLQRRWRWAVTAGSGWLCVGLLSGWTGQPPDELRCTFLAVGHGGCTVLETPDGRTLLYDAGALGGPDVTRRQIAPYLWSRGIRRIDELFLSHADLDHFKGLPALLDRFAVGQVTWTPTFHLKPTLGVPLTVSALERHGITTRVARAGDRFRAGALEMEVLHPPPKGPEGNENARSLVLLIRHAGHTILLTGDLEGPGLKRVLNLPPPQVDVLMAPHHGSRVANTPELAAWARPRVVISCQGPPRGPAHAPDPYTGRGTPLLTTARHGAVTIRSRSGSLTLETYRTGQRLLFDTEAAH
jgi:competence protein ComEC